MSTQLTYTAGQNNAARLIKGVSEGRMKASKEEIVTAVRALGYESGGTKDALVDLAYAKAIVVGKTYAEEQEAQWREESRAAFPAKVAQRVAACRLKFREWVTAIDLAKNPMWEMERCDEAVERAARVETWLNIEAAVQAGQTPEEIHAEMLKRLTYLACTQRHSSTSIGANMAEEIRRLVLADILTDSAFANCGLHSPRWM